MRSSYCPFVLLASLPLLACPPDRGGDDDGGGGARDAAADAARDAEPEPEPDAEVWPDAGIVEDEVIVWAHSAQTLYAFDPRTETVTPVGDFQDPDGNPVDNMTDLAVDRDGRMLTCSNLALFSVDPETAVATQVAVFPIDVDVRFYGLTFLPEGVLDADQETLVGATNNGEYYRIDPDTGVSELLGQFSDGYVLSGDIVSVVGAGTFATVKRNDIDTDVLVDLDPRTGEVTPIGGPIGFVSLFGLGYWRSRLYGFSSRGELVEIDVERGTGALVTDQTGADQFWGAGVTTIAPVGPF